MSESDVKPCRRCGARDRLRPNRWDRHGACRPCSREKGAAWRTKNPGYRRTCPGGGYTEEAKAVMRRHAHAGWAPGEHERSESLRPFVENCGACGANQPGARGWQADHDHNTGRFRDFLCRRCNLGLGQFEKITPERAAAFAAYLKRHGSDLGILEHLAPQRRRRVKSEP